MAENDISASISKLLEDPEAMKKILSIAGTLMKNSSDFENTGTVSEKEKSSSETVSSQKADEADIERDPPMPDLSALPKLLGSLGGTQKSASDPSCALLYALKPYMAHGRADRIDSLIRVLKLSELAGGLFQGNGIL